MASRTKFNAVLFDLGGTLMQTVDAPKVYKRILDIFGVHVPIKRIAKVHSETQRGHNPAEMAECGQQYWTKWNVRVVELLGIRENVEFLAGKIDELWWEYADPELHSDVAQTLTRLRAMKVKMGLVSNAFENELKRILQKLNVEEYFPVVVGVDACNRAKPDSAIFLHALSRLRVRPEETIFVGDSLEADYMGAKKAGLKPLLINRKETQAADAETITSLAQVLSYFG